METKDSIYFYKESDKYGYFSNFYKSEFVDKNNIKFCCTEKYLMYMKAITFEPQNTKLLNQILNEKNPSKIKYLGRCVKNYDDDIWSNIRYDIMIEGLRYKFNQNTFLKNKLVDTKNKTLYEASKYDKIWGIGYYPYEAVKKDKQTFGSNLLGKALMEIRDELQ